MKRTRWFSPSSPHLRPSRLALLSAIAFGGMTAAACLADLPDHPVTLDQVGRGRLLVVSHDCAGCHNPASLQQDATRNDPADPKWLSGAPSGFYFTAGPGGRYKTYPANLTPDRETGLGSYTARQVFNALRYGLDPAQTQEVIITSTTPGKGGFPVEPHYLAPPMPWVSWRYMADAELWDIVAYLLHGIKPVPNKVKDSQGPNDYWAGVYAEKNTGAYPLPVYPADNEAFQP